MRAPLCGAPVPGGCGRYCEKIPTGYRSMCSGHVGRKKRGQSLETPIGSTPTGRPRSVARVDGLFPTTCPRCRVTRLRKNNPGRRRDGVCASCQRSGKATCEPFVASDEVIARYLDGTSAAALAAELGKTPWTVLRGLQRRGVRTRNMSDAIRLTTGAQRIGEAAARMRATGEMSKRLSAGQQGIALSKWDGFRSTYWHRERSSERWRAWRMVVFRRDGFRCVACGCASRRRDGGLEPHHIRTKSRFPHLVYDVNNGVTLCRICHRETFGKEEEFAPVYETYVRSL